jgi:UDP-2,3-diacylglucosamine hydrolase
MPRACPGVKPLLRRGFGAPGTRYGPCLGLSRKATVYPWSCSGGHFPPHVNVQFFNTPEALKLILPGLVASGSRNLPSPPMMDRPIFITSDVHLGAVPAQTEKAFLSWLGHCGAHASRVVINGDLFDFWFEYGSVIPRGYTRVLGAVGALVDADIPVLLLGGNHDWWGGSYLRNEIGVEFHQEPVVVDLLGMRTFLAHGDGLGPGDRGYRALRWFLRSRPTRLAFRCLHPDVGARIARSVSKTKERPQRPHEGDDSRSRILENWASEQLRAVPELDMVVLGHTHTPRLKEVGPGRYYLNSGDWVTHRSYAVLAAGEPPRLLEWDG